MAKVDLKNERWFKAQLTCGRIFITKKGRVFKLKREEWTETSKPRGVNAYRCLYLKDIDTGRVRTIFVHRLQWIARNGVPEDPELEVNHIDGDKENCSIRNLELITGSMNAQHAFNSGLRCGLLGQANGFSKLQDAEVRAWLVKASSGVFTQKEIAKALNVTTATVSSLIARKIYSHVILSTEVERKLVQLRASYSNARLSDDDVISLLRKFIAGGETYSSLAHELGLSTVTISAIISRKSYKHLSLSKSLLESLAKARLRYLGR